MDTSLVGLIISCKFYETQLEIVEGVVDKSGSDNNILKVL